MVHWVRTLARQAGGPEFTSLAPYLWPQHCGVEILEALWSASLSQQQASDSERHFVSKKKVKSDVGMTSNIHLWPQIAGAQVNALAYYTCTHMCIHTTHMYMHTLTDTHMYTYTNICACIFTHAHTNQQQFHAFSHLLSELHNKTLNGNSEISI